MAEERDKPDAAERIEAASRRLAEMSEQMDETKRRQDEIQRRQDELLDQLGRISRAMDREPGTEPFSGDEPAPGA